jgi:type IV secretory pathway TraG/TraD family ATPase VirD4
VGAIDVLATAEAAGGIPADWAERHGTIYLCWPLHAQSAAGPLVAAVLAGLVRHLQARPAGTRTLLSLDEAPAVGVPGLSHYLSTLGGAGSGVTVCLYTQSVPALVAVYGPHETRSIVGNCAFQVWHRPQDTESAEQLSTLFGEVCEVVQHASSGSSEGQQQGAGALTPSNWNRSASAGASLSTRYRRALNVAEVTALNDDEVIVFLRGKRSRLSSSYAVLQNGLRNLPHPPVPAPAPAPPPAADRGAAETLELAPAAVAPNSQSEDAW